MFGGFLKSSIYLKLFYVFLTFIFLTLLEASANLQPSGWIVNGTSKEPLAEGYLHSASSFKLALKISGNHIQLGASELMFPPHFRPFFENEKLVFEYVQHGHFYSSSPDQTPTRIRLELTEVSRVDGVVHYEGTLLSYNTALRGWDKLEPSRITLKGNLDDIYVIIPGTTFGSVLQSHAAGGCYKFLAN